MMPLDRGLALERTEAELLRAAALARALGHAAMVEASASAPPAAWARLTPAWQPGALRTIGLVGAGAHGADLAATMLTAGLAVRLVERTTASLRAALARIDDHLTAAEAAGRLTPLARAATRARLAGAVDLGGLAGAQIVIEAVPEDFDTKAELFFQVAQVTDPGVPLASATGWLDIDGLADKTGHPGRVGGFVLSPATGGGPRLAEIVEGIETDPATMAALHALARRIGACPVILANAAGPHTGSGAGQVSGHVAGRLWAAMGLAAEHLLAEGANPGEIDTALESFGLAALEASACGLPVVASDVGGLPEVIQDGVSGMRFPSKDVEALAERIRRLVDDPALRQRMGAAGRERALRFAPEASVDAYEALYARVSSPRS